MLHELPATKRLIRQYLGLKIEYGNMLDHCQTGHNFDLVTTEMFNASEKLRSIFPHGRTFAHGYLIINEGLDLSIVETKKGKSHV